ncbi:MAG: PEP-CTERM sorting domain-containing protein [Phycisphaerales bacterium]|nr:PEP-CTERM sorting domain-containing protein [Phycisphaerales bacterium]
MRAYATAILLSLAGSAPVLAEPWRMVILPDTQGYAFATASNPAGLRLFESQTNWIANNKESMNIRFVSHVGDVVDNSNTGQWTAADTAMDVLDGIIPYSVIPGNHDYNRVGYKTDVDSLSGYRTWFGPQRYLPYQWDGVSPLSNTKFFGGYMPETWNGVTSDINFGNSYTFFTAGGRTYLHLGLEWQPDYSGVGAVLGNRGVLNWAQSIVDQYPGMPTIVTTHEDMRDADPAQGNGGTTLFGQYVWNNLIRDNDQIFMVISGHNHFGANNVVNGDGEWRRLDDNNSGNQVIRVMTTFQDWPNFGDGYLRMLTIDPDAVSDNIRFQTYSPYRDLYLTDFIGPTASDFSYSLDFNDRFGVVPEPSSMMLMSLVGLLMLSRRRAS